MKAVRDYITAQRSLGRPFGCFWLARTVSIMGDQIALVAIVTHTYLTSRSAGSTSVVMLAFTVPRLLGPLAGALADRLEARRLMVMLDLAQCAVSLALFAFISSVPATFVSVTLLTLLSTLYLPAGRRSIPRLAPEHATRHAYAAIGTSWNIGWALGPVVGGGLVALGGVRLALGVNIATFAVSALLMRALPPLLAVVADDGRRQGTADVVRTMRQGMSVLLRSGRPRALTVNLFFVVAFGSVDTIALVVLTGRNFGTGSSGYGLLLSLSGIGMLCGSLVISAARRMSTANLLFGGQAVFALGALATGLAPGQAAASPAQWAAGFGNGVENVAGDIVMQESVPEEVLGTVTGAVMAVPFAANLVAYALAPMLVDQVGARWTLAISASGVLVAAIIMRLVLAGRRSEPPIPSMPGAAAAAHERN